MDVKRARDISTSPVMANVTYNGTRVYIEGVNENSGTASVRPLEGIGGRQEVPINNLVEH